MCWVRVVRIPHESEFENSLKLINMFRVINVIVVINMYFRRSYKSFGKDL